jgi:hypothetical protein
MDWAARSILATVVVCVVSVEPLIHGESVLRDEIPDGTARRGPDCQKPAQGLLSECGPLLMCQALGHAGRRERFEPPDEIAGDARPCDRIAGDSRTAAHRPAARSRALDDRREGGEE